jgi:hypothetical protein
LPPGHREVHPFLPAPQPIRAHRHSVVARVE